MAGVEARIVLERADRGFDGVERSAAGFQHTPARQHGGAYTLAELGRSREVGAGTAVNDDGGHAARRDTVGG